MSDPRTWLNAILVLLLLAGCQQAGRLSPAAYESEKDVYIVYQGRYLDRTTSLLPTEVVTDVAFALQEGTHETITDVSGAEVDHYYIWVCLGRACIPVDPFSYSW